jgi:hypothetical protein
MGEWFKDLGRWVLAVLGEWWGWLPSSAIAAIIDYGQNLKWWTVGPPIYAVVLGAGFVYSLFMAWRKQFRLVAASRPLFSMRVESALSNYIGTEGHTLIFLGIRIINKGADSSVLEYGVHTNPQHSTAIFSWSIWFLQKGRTPLL